MQTLIPNAEPQACRCDKCGAAPPAVPPTRIITVRLTRELHEALKAEAHQRQTSMNQLVVGQLLRMMGGEHAAVADEPVVGGPAFDPSVRDELVAG